ncbi:uncharacterized protein METZ01_LOCUS454141, partial [marine metagenome]
VHFIIILPFLGLKEKTLEVPLSITEPVLGGSQTTTMTKDNSNIRDNL